MNIARSLGLLLVCAAPLFIAAPAGAYEDCKIISYAHCMACGARYNYHGEVQRKFCWGMPGTPSGSPSGDKRRHSASQ